MILQIILFYFLYRGFFLNFQVKVNDKRLHKMLQFMDASSVFSS